MLFDTHAHYDDERFKNDRKIVLDNVFKNKISNVINVATDIESSKFSINLSAQYDGIYASIGIHPHNVNGVNESSINELTKLINASNKVVAIGEIGLDYFYDFAPKDLQQYWFRKQINLAKNLKLPVIIHDRDAHQDTLDIVKSENAKDVGGVFHCYSGSIEMAKELLKNNFYLSFAGPTTFKNAKALIEVINFVPLDRFLIETDSPYLSPEPLRGKRNDSTNLVYILQKIANIKNLPYDELAEISTRNAKKLFNIND